MSVQLAIAICCQISILTLFVSTCGVAISVAVSKVEDVPSPAVLFILVNLIPAVASFFSILWIDQVFRHVCLLNYFLILGKKIRESFASNDSEKIEAFGWMKRHKGHSKSLNSYRFRHGIIIVMFFAVILASMAFGILLYGSQSILNAIEPRILIIMEVTMGLVIATFILTMTLYTVIILRTYSEGSK